MKIFIDGREIEAEGKRNILEVARENGVYIPSLCDHPRLIPFAGCRLCIVEIKGRKGFPPSCSTIIEEGMDVITDSPRLRKLRKQIMEFILIEHPNACLICTEKENCDEYKSTIRKVGEVTGCVLCSNNGRCELQEVVTALEIKKVNFPSVYRDLDVIKGDPFFDRNYNLCILCGRCVRVCHEVRGASAISFTYRGTQTVVRTVLDKPLVDSGCQFCGACVDMCPTGALAERALKYELLPDEKLKTICPFCSIGCELELWMRDGRILSSLPSGSGPVNRGQACVKGRFMMRDVVYSSRRILNPMIRKGKELEETTWEEALDFASQKLKKFNGKEVAFLASPQASCEDSFLIQKFAGDVLGTKNVFSTIPNSPIASLQDLGQRNGFVPLLNFKLENISEAKTLFLFGTDITVSHPIIWLEVLKAVRKGARLIVVSPVGLFLNRFSWRWLQIKPGSEYYLLGSLSKILLDSEQGQDFSLIKGFESFEKSLNGLSLSKAREIAGIEEEVLEEVSQLLVEEDSPVFLFGMGLSQYDWGEMATAAIWNLALQTNAKLLPLGSENNQRGLLELCGCRAMIPPNFNKMNEAALGIKIKALYLSGPHPDSANIKTEFLIVQDSFMNENIKKADVVLPTVTVAEEEGTFVNVEGRVQKFNKCVDPLGQAKPGWWILSKLAQRMGSESFNYKKPAEIMAEIKKVNPGFARVSYSNLGKGNEIFIQEKEKGDKNFVPVEFGPLPVGTNKNYPYVMLLDYNLDYYGNLSIGQEVKSFRAIRDSRWVKIGQEDADQLELKDGDRVVIESSSGQFEGQVKVSDTVPKGTIGASFLWSEDSFFSAAAIVLSDAKKERSFRLLPVRIKRGK